MPFTAEQISEALQYDDKVKVAGFDVDGILRGMAFYNAQHRPLLTWFVGKLISKKKFLSILSTGFGFCSVIFGWDMHDKTYFKELTVSNAQNGYRDILARVDMDSFRRIPWECESGVPGPGQQKSNIPFFLIWFLDPDTMEPIAPCPRGFLRRVMEKVNKNKWKAMAGGKSSLIFLRL